MTRRKVTTRQRDRAERTKKRTTYRTDVQGHQLVVEWQPGDDVFAALRKACPICRDAEPRDLVAAAIHHPGDEAQEALPDAEEAPAQTEAPSGSTPVGPGGSRDFRQRTQSS